MRRYVAVTGVCGFIGRVVAEKLLERGDFVYAVDSLTYAADPQVPRDLAERYPGSFNFRCEDIRNLGRLPDVDAVIHLAAETHVDNSLAEGASFVNTNVNGTLHMLDMVRAKAQHGMPHFIHISTDEVYGPITAGAAKPDDPLNPTSPYAASKAAADMLVKAWGTTYNLPYTIVRPSNCYGANQYPEKLIPKCVRSVMLGRPIPIHGDGSMVRSWLWVEDLADAILTVLDHDRRGVVNVGGNTEAKVIAIAHTIAALMGGDSDAAVQMGYVRPAVDVRYAVDDNALWKAGWRPKGDFWGQLPELVAQEKKRFRW